MVKKYSIAWWRRQAKNLPVKTRQEQSDFFNIWRNWSDRSGASYVTKRESERAGKIASFFKDRMKELGWDI